MFFWTALKHTDLALHSMVLCLESASAIRLLQTYYIGNHFSFFGPDMFWTRSM
ncbi:unnamed protein product [Brassica rapa subsp. trilocularis]